MSRYPSPSKSELNSSRQSPDFQPPLYQMTYGHDQTLQWDPPRHLKELTLALSYHFPEEKNPQSKMQAATKEVLGKERLELAQKDPPKPDTTLQPPTQKAASIKTPITEALSLQRTYYPGKPDGVPRTSVKPLPGLKVLTWDPIEGAFNGDENQGKKRRYEKEEARKVAMNRGFTCDEHRRRKKKCNAEFCSRNKQHNEAESNNDEFGVARKEKEVARTTTCLTTFPGSRAEITAPGASKVPFEHRDPTLGEDGVVIALASPSPQSLTVINSGATPTESKNGTNWWEDDRFELDPGGFFNDELVQWPWSLICPSVVDEDSVQGCFPSRSRSPSPKHLNISGDVVLNRNANYAASRAELVPQNAKTGWRSAKRSIKMNAIIPEDNDDENGPEDIGGKCGIKSGYSSSNNPRAGASQGDFTMPMLTYWVETFNL